ncbi:unnamed protein product [Heligmosomoides polygyrus]|uniref:Hemerythrin domain-containing protein n=1 Tax=Heligmosomoides polygyrus TaxID=6339 RepID=A0A183GN63_HELPZ|nr:unnamed protein product [Heligmosomoides polygyrus]
MSQPQRDCDNRFLVMDQHVIETIIDDQLRMLDLHNALFKEIHEALHMEEHNDSQSFHSSVLSSLEGLQKSIDTHFRAHVATSGAEMKAIFEGSPNLAIRKSVDEIIAKLKNSHKNDTQARQPDTPGEGMNMPQEHNAEHLANEEELINDNADYREGINSEDEFERQADEEWLAFR